MGAILQLSRGTFKEKYLPMQLLPGVEFEFSKPDWFGIWLRSLHVEKLTGKSDEGVAQGSVLKVGGYYAVHFGLIKPRNFQALISLNPELLRTAMVQTANILNQDAEVPLSIYIQPLKQMDIADFQWLVQINLID